MTLIKRLQTNRSKHKQHVNKHKFLGHVFLCARVLRISDLFVDSVAFRAPPIPLPTTLWRKWGPLVIQGIPGASAMFFLGAGLREAELPPGASSPSRSPRRLRNGDPGDFATCWA